MNRSAGFNRNSLVHEPETNEDTDDDPDFSNFEEPIIVRLMANMFGQKKSVQEGLEMLPEISVDKIERELKSLKYQAMALKEKEKRDQSQWELHKKAEEFITKFPATTVSNPELMEFGCELSELRQNPYFLALKENKVEQNRLQQIKELQMLMYTKKEDQEESEVETKVKVEPVQTDIFKHTFIDPEAEQETSQSYILDKKPKDVFIYYDLQVELPTELFKHLGDYSIATEN